MSWGCYNICELVFRLREERAKRNGVVHVKEDSRLIKEMDYLPVLKESQPSTPLVSILASSNTSTPSPEKEAPPLSNNSLVNASPVNDYSLIDKSVSRKSLDQNVEPELGVAYKPFSNFSQPNGTNERSRGNSGSVYSPPYQGWYRLNWLLVACFEFLFFMFRVFTPFLR